MKRYTGKVKTSKYHRFSDPVENTARYDRAKRIRSSEAWQKVRDLAMTQAQGMCLYCYENAAEEVHHIESVAECPGKALSIDNLIPLCHRCHGWMTARNKRGEDTVTLLLKRRKQHGGW